jgi:hypothetical protein
MNAKQYDDESNLMVVELTAISMVMFLTHSIDCTALFRKFGVFFFK